MGPDGSERWARVYGLIQAMHLAEATYDDALVQLDDEHARLTLRYAGVAADLRTATVRADPEYQLAALVERAAYADYRAARQAYELYEAELRVLAQTARINQLLGLMRTPQIEQLQTRATEIMAEVSSVTRQMQEVQDQIPPR